MMKSKARFLMVMVCCIAVFISGCSGNQVARVIDLKSGIPADTIITTISWNGNAISFLSEKVEIEERRVVFYGFMGQVDAEEPGIDWALPMGADCPITIYLPMSANCYVCIDGECALFPREIE